MKKIGILRFLGTNCDRDIWQAVESVGHSPEWLWYENQFDADAYDAFILPGGFSYGDYLRSGALAAKAPSMESLKRANKLGKPILGICNGFQILCDAGLLPGALVKNKSLRFIEKWVDLEMSNASPFWGTHVLDTSLPIAHGDGRYYIEDEALRELQENGQIWLTYKKNPNGSVKDIAGVLNKNKNVAGLMPHPERALFDWMGGTDGFDFFK